LAIFVYVETGETGKALLAVIGGALNALAYFAELHSIDHRNLEANRAKMREITAQRRLKRTGQQPESRD